MKNQEKNGLKFRYFPIVVKNLIKIYNYVSHQYIRGREKEKEIGRLREESAKIMQIFDFKIFGICFIF